MSRTLRRSTSVTRMIHLAALAGQGACFHTPDAGAGGGGGGGGGGAAPATPATPTTPAAAATAPAAAVALPAAPEQSDADMVDDLLDGITIEGDAAAPDSAAGDGTEAVADVAEAGDATDEGKEADAVAVEPAAAAEPVAPAAEAKPPETPGEKKPEPAAIDPETAKAEAAQQHNAAQDFTQWQQEFTGIRGKLADGTFDAIEDSAAAMKALVKGFEYVDQSLAELHQANAAQKQSRQESGYWDTWGKANAAVGADKGQAIFAEEMAAAGKKYAGEGARAVATENWQRRVEALKAAPPTPAKPEAAAATAAPATPAKPTAPPAKRPPVVTPNGSRVAPAAASAHRPPTKPRTPEEEFEAATKGSIGSFLDD